MEAVVDKSAALASLRIWVLGDRELVQPLVHYGAQVRALDSIGALYRELAIARCDILLFDTAHACDDLAGTLAHLRRREDLGIVLLVGPETPQWMIEGLWSGADVCLPQSSTTDALAAALYSLRRRLHAEQAQMIGTVTERPPVAPAWALASDGWDLHMSGSDVLALSQSERAFLSLLFASPGETVSRERLIQALTSEPWSFDPHRLEVLVHRLRNRVRLATGLVLPVRAVRGSGYRLIGQLNR